MSFIWTQAMADVIGHAITVLNSKGNLFYLHLYRPQRSRAGTAVASGIAAAEVLKIQKLISSGPLHASVSCCSSPGQIMISGPRPA